MVYLGGRADSDVLGRLTWYVAVKDHDPFTSSVRSLECVLFFVSTSHKQLEFRIVLPISPYGCWRPEDVVMIFDRRRFSIIPELTSSGSNTLRLKASQ